MRKYFPHHNPGSIKILKQWERIFLEEAEGLMKKDEANPVLSTAIEKGRSQQLDPMVEEVLIAENQRLRIEIEYL